MLINWGNSKHQGRQRRSDYGFLSTSCHTDVQNLIPIANENSMTSSDAATKVEQLQGIPTCSGPFQAKKIGILSSYGFIVLCGRFCIRLPRVYPAKRALWHNITDDSGSMQSNTRIPTLRLSVRQLFKEARALNPQNRFSLYTFSSPVWENLNTEPEMESALSNFDLLHGFGCFKVFERLRA